VRPEVKVRINARYNRKGGSMVAILFIKLWEVTSYIEIQWIVGWYFCQGDGIFRHGHQRWNSRNGQQTRGVELPNLRMYRGNFEGRDAGIDHWRIGMIEHQTALTT
jgi:hypothetical protein